MELESRFSPEGSNSKVRTMMRRTYGLRDEEYLELRIKSLHEVTLRSVILKQPNTRRGQDDCPALLRWRNGYGVPVFHC